MNREGNEGEGPSEGTDEAPRDNVIAFPGARVRPSAAPPGDVSAGEDAPPASGASDPFAAATAAGAGASAEGAEGASASGEAEVEEPGMTLDAFERAVRSAVREKLGESQEGRPGGADELVAQVFSALTGKDAKTALDEVRQRLSEPVPVDDGAAPGDVIDLNAVREARQRQSAESAQKIGGALKDTFTQFLATLAQRQGGSGEITLDSGFFKTHGASLLGNLFQGLASALMQQNAPKPAASPAPSAPPAPPAPGATGGTDAVTPSGDGEAITGAPAPGDAPPTTPATPKPPDGRQVQVKLDLGSILAGLFRRRDTPPPPSDPSKPE